MVGKASQRVKCNKCDWILEVESLNAIKDWHHKMCPQCGECEIVNDEDIEYLNGIIALKGLSDMLDPEGKNRVPVHVDSAPLREGGDFIFEVIQEQNG